MGPDPKTVERKGRGRMAPSPDTMEAARDRKRVEDTTSKRAQELRRVTHTLWFKGGTQLLTWMELLLANDRQWEIARVKFLDSLNDSYRELAQAIDIIVDGQGQE